MAESAPVASKESLALQKRSGRLSGEIIATLGGGTLLLTSFLARALFEPSLSPEGAWQNIHADILSLTAAVLMAIPLVSLAVKDLRQGKAHLNALVALAVLAALASRQYDQAASIAFFMIISMLIENRTAIGAQASIESLVRITPTKAHKLSGNQEIELDAKELKTGDVVRVRPGDNIPADGRILRGTSTVNQANITGESLPADKDEGDDVFGGTINLTGVIDVEVTKAGSDTTLGRVKELILAAERSRTPILRMVDRYAGWYTPAVLMVVAIVFFFTLKAGVPDAAQRAVGMLVAACPAALILATPTAMVAALSAAARLGVLVKSVVHLESARNLTAMVFDKTGTLTTGQLQVASMSPLPGVEGVDLLRTAASAEQGSRHPVARAVNDVARRARLTLPHADAIEEVAGRGVRAKLGEQTIIVGRGNWLADPAISGLDGDSVQKVKTAMASPEAEGLSLLFVVRDGRLLGWIGLADNTRPEATSAMDRLRDMGLKRLIIVTGDRESVARRVAAQMHTEYQAEVLPQQKLEIVDELKSRGHKVAVIGDGVNDAPALAAGDISIAMGAAGSDVAIHSASIALMNNNLNRIPFLVHLSRMTSNVIWQNLMLGAVFILTFVSLSAAGVVSPVFTALCQVVSGLLVIFNSARLVRSGEDIEMAEAQALAAQQRRLQPSAPPAATAVPA